MLVVRYYGGRISAIRLFCARWPAGWPSAGPRERLFRRESAAGRAPLLFLVGLHEPAPWDLFLRAPDPDGESGHRRPVPPETAAPENGGEQVKTAWFGLLAASGLEAFFLLVMAGYAPLYVVERLHGSYFVASQSVAWPYFATFLGSNFWGAQSRRLGLDRLVIIGLVGYFGLGLVALLARTAWTLVVGLGVLTFLSSALAPAAMAAMTRAGGAMGNRLALRVRWQSAGWIVSGVSAGYLYGLGRYGWPLTLALSGTVALLLAAVLASKRDRDGILARSPHPPSQAGTWRSLMPLLVVVVPVFLVTAGNEGFFASFSLYLRFIRLPVAWVGWSAAISTAVGGISVGWVGRFADRTGGRTVLGYVLVGYALVYGAIAVSHSPAVAVLAFSLPLYPFLMVGSQRAAAERVALHHHGAAMGVVNGLAGLATAVGISIMGLGDTRFGPAFEPWGAAILALLAIAALLLFAVLGPRTEHPLSGTS